MLMKRLFTICLIILCTSRICLTQMIQKYEFDEIPKAILPGASIVIRSAQKLFCIKSPSEGYSIVKEAITLVNSSAAEIRYIRLPYDKFESISNIKGNIYDKSGHLIYKIGINDIMDLAGDWAPGIISDNRVKEIAFPVRAYPYTIEYEYKITYHGLLNYPELDFSPETGIAVERRGMQCLVPKSMPFRFKEQGLKFGVDSVTNRKYKIYTWQEENIPAKEIEPWLIVNKLSMPYVKTAPTKFSVGGYDGDLSSWTGFGNWIQIINRDRDVPDAETVATVKKLITGISDKKEIVKRLYEYMQSTTRYVSIQLGIGGWQTAPAFEVRKTGYGDCKALSNYMHTLLRAAGINSYYTLIKAGKYENSDPNFPLNDFTHIILNVPLPNDTIWLECTDQDCPFGYLGTFTDNRYALAVSDNDVKLVHTPGYSKNDNRVENSGSVSIAEDGTAEVSMHLNRTGLLYEEVNSISQLDKKNSIDWLSGKYSNKALKLDTIQFSIVKNRIPEGKMDVKLSLRNFANRGGNLLIYSPCILGKAEYISEKSISGMIALPYIVNDSIVFILPAGYSAEYIPAMVNIKEEFGSYQAGCSIHEGKIVFTRHFELNDGSFDKAKKVLFSQWINVVARLDRRNVVLSPN
jgi:Domain of Unknown Function with PDB structure (DUF3857)/Transglutaminase-like superfamily